MTLKKWSDKIWWVLATISIGSLAIIFEVTAIIAFNDYYMQRKIGDLIGALVMCSWGFILFFITTIVFKLGPQAIIFDESIEGDENGCQVKEDLH